jgi:hypothetical protein
MPRSMRRRHRLGFAVALGALVVAAGAEGARAAGEGAPGVQRVALLPLGFHGAVPEAAQARIRQRLVEGLAAARFEVLAGEGLRGRLEASGAAPCAEPSCYPALARAVGVGYLVSGRVVEQEKTYDIRLELLNGRTGATLASVHERCETCGLEDAAEKANLAASALRARLEAVTRMPARFVIRSRPPAAPARIDGRPVGNTPLDLELPSGEHQLTLELANHEPLRRTLVVVSGVDETLDLELVRRADLFPYRPIGWSALALGAVALGSGIYALVLDGKEVSCAPSEEDAQGHCPRVHSTSVLGGVLLGVGSASAAVGAISLYLGASRSAPSVALGVAGRF